MKSWFQALWPLWALAALARGQGPPGCPLECSCDSFHTVSCGGRGLTQPPAGYWPSVTTLVLGNNDITALNRYSFTGFPNLVQLHLSRNRIEQLDFEVFSPLQSLLYLYLDDNELRRPVAEYNAEPLKLMGLFLQGNKIDWMDANLLAKVAPNLVQVNLTGNPIAVQPGWPTIKHPKLQIVDMSSTARLQAGSYSFTVPSAFRLHLSSSGIATVSDHAFKAGSKTTFYLYLNDNPLTAFSVGAVSSAMAGGVVNIDDTPLACSCGHKDLAQWANSTESVALSAKCGGVDKCSF